MYKALATAVFCVALAPATLTAEVIKLQPANPQPSAGALSPGLAVDYTRLPGATRDLATAKRTLEKKGEAGTPLAGLAYDDTDDGDLVLTSDRKQMLGAAISGYIKFERAGTYTLDFLSNDGLEIAIGGQNVGVYDGVHACGYVGEVDVSVPKAGYYPVEATYFQRKGTACLMMEWGPDSDGLELVPDSAFFH